MRILEVVHQFLPRHVAGTEVYTYQLTQALRGRGHEVSIYCREEGHPEAVFFGEEDEYHGLPVRRVYYNPPPGPLRLARKALARFRNPRVERDFADYLARWRPDVVHFQHLFKLSGALISIAARMGIPTVVTLHDYWFLCDNGQLLRPGFRLCAGPRGGLRCPGCAELPLSPSLRWLLVPVLWPLFIYRTCWLRRQLRQADALISPSAFLADVFARHGFPQVIISDNGTDTSWSQDVRPAPCPRLRFGYIGTLAPHKGAHLLIRAFQELDQGRAELRIYGDLGTVPDYAAALRQMATGPTIHFLGPFERGEIARVFSEIDVLVVPSLWPENSPLAVHEAIVARVPVLAADVGGLAELVRGSRAGWLFRAGDVNDLRLRMEEIIRRPEVLAEVRADVPPVKNIAEQAAELEALYVRVAQHGRARKS